MLKLAAGILVGIALATASSALATAPLAALKWKSRILVVSAPSAADPALATQNQWLAAAEVGLRDRDLVVIRIVGGKVDAPGGIAMDAQALRAAVGLEAARFDVALVGKDGSKALQQSEPLTMRSLFAAIDAMPMRQDEMRRRKP